MESIICYYIYIYILFYIETYFIFNDLKKKKKLQLKLQLLKVNSWNPKQKELRNMREKINKNDSFIDLFVLHKT